MNAVTVLVNVHALLLNVHFRYYSSTCHEGPPPVRTESGPSWQMAARYRDINTAKTVVGTLQKWPTKAGGRSPKGPAMAGTTVANLLKKLKLMDLPIISSHDAR